MVKKTRRVAGAQVTLVVLSSATPTGSRHERTLVAAQALIASEGTLLGRVRVDDCLGPPDSWCVPGGKFSYGLHGTMRSKARWLVPEANALNVCFRGEDHVDAFSSARCSWALSGLERDVNEVEERGARHAPTAYRGCDRRGPRHHGESELRFGPAPHRSPSQERASVISRLVALGRL
jgi:hypothetical protein